MALRDDRFIKLLKDKQAEHADAALSSPRSDTDRSFEYGRVSGLYQGLKLAETLYFQLISDEAKQNV